MQSEEFTEGKDIDIMKKAVVKKKTYMTQRKDTGKTFTLKEILELFHDIESAKDSVGRCSKIRFMVHTLW